MKDSCGLEPNGENRQYASDLKEKYRRDEMSFKQVEGPFLGPSWKMDCVIGIPH